MPEPIEADLLTAQEILTRVNRVRKQKSSGWKSEELVTNKHGEIGVICTFNTDTPAVQRWFVGAGASAYRFAKDPTTGKWTVWFESRRVVEETH